ncbi:MAG: hypothetical protein AB7P04_12365 [Bacteriovoracia bacterium]
MNAVVVWIDHEHAKLYSFSAERMSREILRATYVDHHTHLRDRAERGLPGLFREVADRVRGAQGILIVGPGTARSEFLHYLQADEKPLAARVVACEPVDHPSDAEIATFAARYFQRPLAS